MNKLQTYDICEYFTYSSSCPHINKELMKGLINDLDLSDGGAGRKLDVSKIVEKAEKVNRLFCNTCTSFKDIRG